MTNVSLAQNDQVNQEVKAPTPIRKDVELTAEQRDLASFEPDHDGNAKAVHMLYGDVIRFNDAMGWLYWNGRYWAKDRQAVKKAVVETLRLRCSYAHALRNDRVEQRCTADMSNINGTMAALEVYAATPVDWFDTEDDFLPVLNGIIDLRIGILYPHDSKRGFTWNVAAEYSPDADYTEWESTLTQNVEGGMEVVRALQMWTGYMFTGHTRDEKALYLQGPTRAGKGLFKETIKSLTPDPIAQEKDFKTFTARKDEDTDNFDLASLRNARMVFASESNRYQSLNAAKVKNMTGGDEMTAAYKGKDSFRFKPKFKVCLLSNFEVNADVDDDAVWGRLIVVHFPNSYLNKEDTSLKERFKSDEMKQAVLRWSVEGAIEWYRAGRLYIPETLTKLKQAHREKLDTVAMWIEECVEEAEGNFAPSSLIVQSYTRWCQTNSVEPKKARYFTEALLKRMQNILADSTVVPVLYLNDARRVVETTEVKKQRGYWGLKIV